MLWNVPHWHRQMSLCCTCLYTCLYNLLWLCMFKYFSLTHARTQQTERLMFPHTYTYVCKYLQGYRNVLMFLHTHTCTHRHSSQNLMCCIVCCKCTLLLLFVNEIFKSSTTFMLFPFLPFPKADITSYGGRRYIYMTSVWNAG